MVHHDLWQTERGGLLSAEGCGFQLLAKHRRKSVVQCGSWCYVGEPQSSQTPFSVPEPRKPCGLQWLRLSGWPKGAHGSNIRIGSPSRGAAPRRAKCGLMASPAGDRRSRTHRSETSSHADRRQLPARAPYGWMIVPPLRPASPPQRTFLRAKCPENGTPTAMK